MNRAILAAALTVFALQAVSAADQWPQFRGLQAGVAADDPTLPDTWSETENVAWKIPIQGLGWSSPVVWDNHIFLTAAISAGTEKPPVPGLYDDQGGHRSTAEHRWVLYDVDFATGKIRWERELRRGVPSYPKHLKNSFASETPVTDGELVYVYFGSIGLIAAVDMNGKTVWTKELGTFGTNRNGAEYGSAASPVLHENRLYIVNDNLTQSFIAAFDAKTGAEIWRTRREYPRYVALFGSMLYAVDSPAGFYVVDPAAAEPLDPVGAIQTPDAGFGRIISIGVSDQSDTAVPKIAVVSGGRVLQIYDISKPAAPVLLSTLATPGRGPRMTMKGRTVYVADNAEGIQVVDLSTPAKPRIVGSYKTAKPAIDVAAVDSLLYVATGRSFNEMTRRFEGDEFLILRHTP